MMVELAVSVALMGILGIGLLVGTATGVRSASKIERSVVADYLVRQQMEAIKAAAFSGGSYSTLSTLPGGMSIQVTSPAAPNADSNLQQVQVVVQDHGVPVETVTGYKLNR